MTNYEDSVTDRLSKQNGNELVIFANNESQSQAER